MSKVFTASDEDHRFQIGESLWPKNGVDQQCYIPIGFKRSTFTGTWIMELVRERDLTGRIYEALEDAFTANPPPAPTLHPEQPGVIYITGTGAPLKAIPHFSLCEQ